MKKASEDNKKIARIIYNAFGSKPKVFSYGKDDTDLKIDVAECHNSPDPGLASYSTIGLSDYEMLKDGNPFHVRLEIAGLCKLNYDEFGNILASAAFYIMRTQWLCFPGAILENALDGYSSPNLQHLYFTSPFLWEDSLKATTLGSKKVAWLLAIPISEKEREYARENSSDALEELFEEKGADFYNLNRSSLV